MNKLTVAKRIILGFTSLIVIAIGLGLLAIYKMQQVSGGAVRLEQAYIPETSVSTSVELSLLNAMLENRGYDLTENTKYYDAGQKHARSVLEHLDTARELAEAQDLTGMKKSEPKIREGVTSYFETVEATREKIAEIARYRQAMDQASAAFLKSNTSMLESQEQQMTFDVNDRIRKVTLVTSIMQHGNSARVANFRGQASKDSSHLDKALAELDGAIEDIDELSKITVIPEDLKNLENLSMAVRNYSNEIARYTEEVNKDGSTQSSRFDEITAAMDRTAGVFTQTVESFLADQTARLEKGIAERLNKITWTNNILDLGNEARVANFRAQALRDPEIMGTAVKRIEEMDTYFQLIRPITRDPSDIAMLDESRSAALNYRTAMEGYLGTFIEMQELSTERAAIAYDALAQAQALADMGTEGTLEIASESVTRMNGAITMLIIGLVLATSIGGALALFITRSINRPLTQAIRDLSAGANETSSASSQVSSASQSLAEGASEQAASLEETSSSMEEMTSMVARNLEVAQKTNQQAKEARTAADSGVHAMGELRERADAVSTSAAEMESAMQAIKQSSDSISKIIKTIDEIAFQTNILALNAAVEAARAGEAGAGFAVVADEVRSLARRAAEAAQETASMIEDSMERSERGVRVNETVGRNLRDVLDKASQVENGLKSISSVVTGVNEAMNELEASVREQQDGITQINTAVNQVNEVTQANAASAEEAASAAEEMSAQSVNLTEIVATLTEMVSGSSELVAVPSIRRERGVKPSRNGRSGYAHVASSPESTSNSKNGNGEVNVKRYASRMEKTFSLPGDFE